MLDVSYFAATHYNLKLVYYSEFVYKTFGPYFQLANVPENGIGKLNSKHCYLLYTLPFVEEMIFYILNLNF